MRSGHRTSGVINLFPQLLSASVTDTMRGACIRGIKFYVLNNILNKADESSGTLRAFCFSDLNMLAAPPLQLTSVVDRNFGAAAPSLCTSLTLY